MPNGEDWGRLRDYVISRRRQIGIATRRDMAEVSGVSIRTLAQVERAKSVNANTLASIESVLDWKPGSARKILAGGEPELAASSSPAADPRPAEIRDLVTIDEWEEDPQIRTLWQLQHIPAGARAGIVSEYMRARENTRDAEVTDLRRAAR